MVVASTVNVYTWLVGYFTSVHNSKLLQVISYTQGIKIKQVAYKYRQGINVCKSNKVVVRYTQSVYGLAELQLVVDVCVP